MNNTATSVPIVTGIKYKSIDLKINDCVRVFYLDRVAYCRINSFDLKKSTFNATWFFSSLDSIDGYECDEKELVKSDIKDDNSLKVIDSKILILPDYFKQMYEDLLLPQEIFYINTTFEIVDFEMKSVKNSILDFPSFSRDRDIILWSRIIVRKIYQSMRVRGGGRCSHKFPMALSSFLAFFGTERTQLDNKKKLFKMKWNFQTSCKYLGDVDQENLKGWCYRTYDNSTSYNEICFSRLPTVKNGFVRRRPWYIFVDYLYTKESLRVAYDVNYVIGTVGGIKIND